MLAVVKAGPGPGVELRELPIPDPPPDEVIVRVRSVGICGTDLPIIEGHRSIAHPLILGHEFAGVVDRLGTGVHDVAVGTRVAVRMILGCQTCPTCLGGRENMCPNVSEIGIHRDGAYAEYVAAPARALHRIADATSFDQGASVDPLASSFRGIRRLDPQPATRVLVMGAGPVGLYAIQALQAVGVRAVAAIVRTEGPRSEAARTAGATVFDDRAPVADIAEALGGAPELVIETTGHAAALAMATTMLAAGGSVLAVSIYHDEVSLNPGRLTRDELVLTGTFGYVPDDFAASLELIERGAVTPVISHHLPLADFQEALALLHTRQAVKVMLHP